MPWAVEKIKSTLGSLFNAAKKLQHMIFSNIERMSSAMA